MFTLRPDRVTTQSIKGPGTAERISSTSGVRSADRRQRIRHSVAGLYRRPGNVAGERIAVAHLRVGRGTNSFEARVTATNVFNTVQYTGMNIVENSANFGQVTSARRCGAASAGTVQVLEQRRDKRKIV